MKKLPRIVGGSVVLALAATAALTGPAHAEDSSQQKLESALATSQKSLASNKAQAATAQQNLTTSQARLASQQAVLSQATADVSQARKRDEELGAKLATAQANLKKADDAVAAGKKQLAADRKRYATTMNRLVQQSSPLQSVSVFTTNMTTTDINQRTQWSSVATNVSKDAVDRISKQVTKLQADERKQAAATKAATRAKAESASQLETTKTLESEAKLAADAVAATVALNKADAEQAQAKLRSNRAQIASLTTKVEAARQAAIEASNRLARQAAAAERRAAARKSSSSSAGKASSSTAGSYSAVANYNGVDPWGFYWGQCVSYAAWKVRSTTSWSSFQNDTNGVHFGNAVNWGAAARQIGVAVNTSPAVGSVAWRTSGSAGHVAWVTGVNGDGTINVSEYNYNVAGGFGTRSHVDWRSGGSSGFDGFIHF